MKSYFSFAKKLSLIEARPGSFLTTVATIGFVKGPLKKYAYLLFDTL